MWSALVEQQLCIDDDERYRRNALSAAAAAAFSCAELAPPWWRQQHVQTVASHCRTAKTTGGKNLLTVEKSPTTFRNRDDDDGRTRWKTHTPTRWKRFCRSSARMKRLVSATNRSSELRRSTGRTVSRGINSWPLWYDSITGRLPVPMDPTVT